MVDSNLEKFSKLLDPVILDSEKSIKDFFDREILTENIIAIDLESDRNERFGHNLSLIQLGTKEKQYLVDPIALNGSNIYSEKMNKLLSNEDIIKLFYSGMEDIQVLKREFNGTIKNIYDVQYANAFLENSNLLLGLEKAVKNVLNIKLPEELFKYQKTDWSKRPLTDEMVWYASFDVAFLIDLYYDYNEKLQLDKNKAMFLRYFHSLELIEPVDEEVAELVRFLKMHDYDKLDNLNKLLAFRLHKFRIAKAKQINRPSHFILTKRDIDKLLNQKPTTVKQYKTLQIYRLKKDPTFKTDIVTLVKNTLDQYEKDNTLYDTEVKPIENLVLKLGRKDLHLVNKDLTLTLDIDLDVYKQRKYILNQWRSEKAEKEKISRKDLILSQFTINVLAKHNIKEEQKLPDVQGIDEDFKKEYEQEIVALFK